MTATIDTDLANAIDQRVTDHLAAFEETIVGAIVAGSRARDAGQPAKQGTQLSVLIGTVEQVHVGYVDVLLDGSTATIPIASTAQVTEGDRVVVLIVPPASAFIIGLVGAGSGPNPDDFLIGSAPNTVTNFTTLDQYGTGGGGAWVMRAANGTESAPTNTAAGDLLGMYAFGGFGDTAFGFSLPGVFGTAAEPWTDAAQGASVSIYSTATGHINAREAARFADTGSLIIGDIPDLYQAAPQVAITTTATSTIIAPFSGSFTFTRADIGKTISGNSANPTIVDGSVILNVAADGTTATLSHPATATSALLLVNLGAFSDISAGFGIRTDGLFTGHVATVPNGTATSPPDPFSTVADMTVVDHFYDDTVNSPQSSYVGGPRGLHHTEGKIVFGPNFLPKDCAGGPTYNITTNYIGQQGFDVNPGGTITGIVDSSAVIANSNANTLSMFANQSHWSNKVFTSYNGGTLNVGEVTDFISFDIIQRVTGGVLGAGLETTVGRWTGFQANAPSVIGHAPLAPSTLGTAIGFDVGVTRNRTVPSVTATTGSADVVAATNQFSPADEGALVYGFPFIPWTSTATFAIGDDVIFLGNIYQSLVNANTNNVPTATIGTDWADLGPAPVRLFILKYVSPTTVTLNRPMTGSFTADMRIHDSFMDPFGGPAWSATTVYQTGDAVQKGAQTHISNVDNNLGQDPTLFATPFWTVTDEVPRNAGLRSAAPIVLTTTDTQDLTGGLFQINPVGGVCHVQATADTTITAVPAIDTSNLTDGAIFTVINVGAFTITLPVSGALKKATILGPNETATWRFVAGIFGGLFQIGTSGALPTSFIQTFTQTRDPTGNQTNPLHVQVNDTINYSGTRVTAADGHTTSGSAAISSASAAFDQNDVGKTISGTGIPGSGFTASTILTVTDATHATISANATATNTNTVFTIGGDGLTANTPRTYIPFVASTFDGTHGYPAVMQGPTGNIQIDGTTTFLYDAGAFGQGPALIQTAPTVKNGPRVTAADVHLTNGSATVTSASAAFLALDTGAVFTASVSGVPANCTLTYVNATTATMSGNFTGTTTTTATGSIWRKLNLPSAALINNSPSIIADTVQVGIANEFTISAPGIQAGYANPPGIYGITDDQYFGAINGGWLNASSVSGGTDRVSVGFWSLPVWHGKVNMAARYDIYLSEAYMAPDLLGNTPVLDKHVGLYVQSQRLATINWAAVINGPLVAFDVDTTYTSPLFKDAGVSSFGFGTGLGGALMSVQNNYTLDFANATQGAVLQNSGTWQFKQSSNAFTGGSLIQDVATYKNARRSSSADGHTVNTGSTAAQKTITSATMAFTASDVNAIISGTNITPGTTIASVTNATTAVMSAVATGTATNTVFTITANVTMNAGVYGAVITNQFVGDGTPLAYAFGISNVDFYSGATYKTLNSGSITGVNGHISFQSALTVNSGAGVFTRVGYQYNDATGTGSPTVQYGILINALTAGAFNIGLSNASTTIHVPGTAQVVSATVSINPTSTLVEIKPTANVILPAPVIGPSQAVGQVLDVLNVSAFTVTYMAGRGALLPGGVGSVVQQPNQRLTFVRSSALGTWVMGGGNAGSSGTLGPVNAPIAFWTNPTAFTGASPAMSPAALYATSALDIEGAALGGVGNFAYFAPTLNFWTSPVGASGAFLQAQPTYKNKSTTAGFTFADTRGYYDRPILQADTKTDVVGANYLTVDSAITVNHINSGAFATGYNITGFRSQLTANDVVANRYGFYAAVPSVLAGSSTTPTATFTASYVGVDQDPTSAGYATKLICIAPTAVFNTPGLGTTAVSIIDTDTAWQSSANGTTTNTSQTITTSTSFFQRAWIGDEITSSQSGIPAGTTITAVASATSATISAPATVTHTTTATFTVHTIPNASTISAVRTGGNVAELSATAPHRVETGIALTAGANTLTSASAVFTTADIGSLVTNGNFADGTTIISLGGASPNTVAHCSNTSANNAASSSVTIYANSSPTSSVTVTGPTTSFAGGSIAGNNIGFYAEDMGTTAAGLNYGFYNLGASYFGGLTIDNAGQVTLESVAATNLINRVEIGLSSTQAWATTTGMSHALLSYTGTDTWAVAPNAFGMFSGVKVGGFFQNDPGATINLTPISAFTASYTKRIDTKTGRSLSTDTDYGSSPTYAATNSGTFTSGTHQSFSSSPTLNATGSTLTAHNGLVSGMTVTAGTVTTLTHVLLNDATGAGTVGTQIGVDIAAMSAATNNIGLRNAAKSVYTPSGAQALIAATTIAPNATMIQITSVASITLTATPTITAGSNGQLLVIVNNNTTAARNITFQSEATAAGTNLSLATGTVVVGPRGSLTLIYSTTLSRWVQIGQNVGNN